MRASISVFPSLFDPNGRRVDCTWSKLLGRFGSARAFARKEDAPRWSASVFHGNRRSLANVIDVGAVVLDVDDGAPLERLVDVFGDLFGVAHSTWSSSPDCPRWRVVVPLDRRVDVAAYDRCWRWLAHRLEAAGVKPDYAARDASRIWAVPATSPGGTYACHVFDGALASVDEGLAVIPEQTPEPIHAAFAGDRGDDLAHRLERARRYIERCDPAIAGAGGHRTTFRVAMVLVRGFDLGEDDALALLAEYNERCQPAWSLRDLRHKIRSASARGRLQHGWLANAKRAG